MRNLLCLLTVIGCFSSLAHANRFGDSWEAGHERIHRTFYPGHDKGHPGFTVLFSTSSTTTSTLAFTTGGNMLRGAQLRNEFINQNLYAVKLDSAKGDGEFVETLAQLSGCDQPEVQAVFASQMRKHFAEVFSSVEENDPQLLSNRVDNLIDQNPQMRVLCQLGEEF